ncbi:MAG: PKD domain-containing protein [Thermoplasmata archaeon]|nr:PKD domain-containing protein [Thermoplasmata archaeon]MBE3137254.1 PKD domain-containing protein [Thermoplasmata archaeon]MBE3141205.1 PKD domain-containing protein [Thermoplasmata archaeon]
MGKERQIKKGLVLIITIISICIGFFACTNVAIAAQTTYDMGSITIHGPTNNAYVQCLPPTENLLIKVGPNGNTITIQVNYSMNCPGNADNGYCDISFVGGGSSDSRQTSGTDSGYLTISKFMNPGDSFTVKLHAKYTDLFGLTILGEDTEYASGTVESVSLPFAAFSSSPSNPTKDDSIQFNDLSTSIDTTILSWSWDFGDSTSSTARNPYHEYQNSGNYSVTLQVIDDYGQSDSQTNSITINEKPIADFSYSPTAPSTANNIQFTDTSTDTDGTVTSWSWDFGDGTTGSIGENPTHQYQKAGTYDVKLQVTDNNGATDLKTISVTIKEKGIPGFEVSIVIGAIALIFLCKRYRKKDNQ